MAILSEAPKGAEILDLGAARAARAEARSGQPYIKLSAGYVPANAEVRIDTAFLIDQGDVKGTLACLVTDPDDVEALLKDGLTAQDIQAIMQWITGLTVGESQASLNS